MSRLTKFCDFHHEFCCAIVHVRDRLIVIGDPVRDINNLLFWYPKRGYVICGPWWQGDDHPCMPIQEALRPPKKPRGDAILLECAHVDECLRPEIAYLEH